MDVEKERRAELVAALGEQFICFEEVALRHPLFSKHRVRADIVAIPLDKRLENYALAFEVKEPKHGYMNYASWSQAMRQAADYVYAKIEGRPNRPDLTPFIGRRISGAFLFPSPAWNPAGHVASLDDPFVRPGDEKIVTGAMHLALHLRVGRGFWEKRSAGRRFVLSFGPNEVWRSDSGFMEASIGLITGKRTLGSQKLDVMAELDGLGSNA